MFDFFIRIRLHYTIFIYTVIKIYLWNNYYLWLRYTFITFEKVCCPSDSFWAQLNQLNTKAGGPTSTRQDWQNKLKGIVHPKMKKKVINYRNKQTLCSSSEHFLWNPRAFWPCIDSNALNHYFNHVLTLFLGLERVSCVAVFGFGTRRGWVINDVIFIFGWTKPLSGLKV